MDPGTAELEDCESLFTHLTTKNVITGNYLARHFSRIQRAPEGVDLEMRIGYQGRRISRAARPRCETTWSPFWDSSIPVDFIRGSYVPLKMWLERSEKCM